jgi:urate oxidase
MASQLIEHLYGKSQVRVTRLDRSTSPHRVSVASVSIQLQGDFADSYLTGDNSQVIATDTMKNTVFALARQTLDPTIEDFAARLARHFASTYDQVERAVVEISEENWRAITVGGNARPHAFSLTGPESATAMAVAEDNGVEIAGGLQDLQIMKTANSGFADFFRDRFTTLGDTDDRIFATSVEASWLYDAGSAEGSFDYRGPRQNIRDALLQSFADHRSLSVQQTLFAMANAALQACGNISEISLSLPNQHHLLVDLQAFELNNPNVVFMATDEPYGLIQATVRRGV